MIQRNIITKMQRAVLYIFEELYTGSTLNVCNITANDYSLLLYLTILHGCKKRY
jgi:hypothetical protein